MVIVVTLLFPFRVHPFSYQNREGWAPAMYLKKPSPSQIQAIGSSSLRREDDVTTAREQVAAKAPGKGTIKLFPTMPFDNYLTISKIQLVVYHQCCVLIG